MSQMSVDIHDAFHNNTLLCVELNEHHLLNKLPCFLSLTCACLPGTSSVVITTRFSSNTHPPGFQDITSSLPFHRISLDKIEENNAIDQDLQVTNTHTHARTPFPHILFLHSTVPTSPCTLFFVFSRATWCRESTAALRSRATCRWAMVAWTTRRSPSSSVTWRLWAKAHTFTWSSPWTWSKRATWS